MGNSMGKQTRLAKKACEDERTRTIGATGNIQSQQVGLNVTTTKHFDVNDCVAGHLEKGTFDKKKNKAKKDDDGKKCIIM